MTPVDSTSLLPSAASLSRAETSGADGQDDRLRAAARELEASFLAEMLKSAGVGEPLEGWGGGHGEEQFGSFLRQAHADEMAEAGGIGLAESIFHSLKERADV